MFELIGKGVVYSGVIVFFVGILSPLLIALLDALVWSLTITKAEKMYPGKVIKKDSNLTFWKIFWWRMKMPDSYFYESNESSTSTMYYQIVKKGVVTRGTVYKYGN